MVISKDKLRFIVLIFVCVIFFKPLAINSLPEYAKLNSVWDLLRVLVFLVVTVEVLRIHKISHMLLSVIVCQSIFFLSTYISNGNIKGLIVQAASVIGFCMFVEVEGKKDLKRFYNALFDGLSVLIVIHTIFLVFKPEGFGYDSVYYNTIYFLASKNGLAKFLLPVVVSGFVCYELNPQKARIKVVSMVVLSLVLSIIVKSTTTLVGLIICVGLYWCSKSGVVKKIRLNINRISIVIFAVVIVASIIAVNGGLDAIVGMILDSQKTSNYLSRVVIWQKAIALISESFLIGYGMPYNGGHININGKFMYSHNGYLEFFLYGGLIGAVCCLQQLFFVFRPRNGIRKDSLCIPVVCGIIGFAIMMMTESHIGTVAYWGFFIMFEQLLYYERKMPFHKTEGEIL